MHVLADSDVGQGFFWVMLYIGAGMWALRRMSKKCGTDGIVKSAAKRGVARLFSRLTK